METQQQNQAPEQAYTPQEHHYPAGAYYQRPRQNHRNLALILIVVGMLWLAIEVIGNGLPFGGRTQSISQNFPASSQQIFFDLGSADLVLEVEERDDILVELNQSGFWGGPSLSSEQDSTQLSIVNYGSGNCFFNCEMSYRVVMPANQALEIQTDSGNVQLDGDLGTVILNSSSGDISIQNSDDLLELSSDSGSIVLENITANISAVSSSGDIQLDTITAERAEISTDSGEVQLNDVNAQVVQVTSSSGDISLSGSVEQLELSSSSGEIEVENDLAQALNLQSSSGDIRYRGALSGENTITSDSGNVDVELDNPTDLSLSLNTSSGSIDTEFDLSIEEQNEYVLQGSMGDGSVGLTVNTTSGDIQIGE